MITRVKRGTTQLSLRLAQKSKPPKNDMRLNTTRADWLMCSLRTQLLMMLLWIYSHSNRLLVSTVAERIVEDSRASNDWLEGAWSKYMSDWIWTIYRASSDAERHLCFDLLRVDQHMNAFSQTDLYYDQLQITTYN